MSPSRVWPEVIGDSVRRVLLRLRPLAAMLISRRLGAMRECERLGLRA